VSTFQKLKFKISNSRLILSKKPKNTPWVYSGDELGGLEKPK